MTDSLETEQDSRRVFPVDNFVVPHSILRLRHIRAPHPTHPHRSPSAPARRARFVRVHTGVAEPALPPSVAAVAERVVIQLRELDLALLCVSYRIHQPRVLRTFERHHKIGRVHGAHLTGARFFTRRTHRDLRALEFE